MLKKSTLFLGILFILITPLYLVLSLKVPINSDSASVVLLAKDILNGNPFLKGWTLSTGSFYTTDTLVYAIGILLFGLNTKVLYVMSSIVYALIVICCLVLSGREQGKYNYTKMIVTLAIIGLPSLFLSSLIFAQAIHMTAILYTLMALIGLSYVQNIKLKYSIFTVLMTLTAIGDPFSVWFAFAPILLVYGYKWVNRIELKESMYTLGSTMGSYVFAKIILAVIGLNTPGVRPTFVEFEKIGLNFSLTVNGILSLFDANVFGKPISDLKTIVTAIHFIGLILVVIATIKIFQSWRKQNSINQIFTLCIVSGLLEYLFSNMPIDITTTRYLTHTIIFGSVLVGRLLPELSFAENRKRFVIAFSLVYLATFIQPLSLHPIETKEQRLSRFLESQHLESGFAPYWASHVVTLHTEGRVKVRPVVANPQGEIKPFEWMSKDVWYTDEGSFIIFDSSNWGNVNEVTATKTFGKPSDVIRFEDYTILKYGSFKFRE